MRGGERCGSRHMPRVVLSVGATEGVGRAVRATVAGGVGLTGCVMGVVVAGGMVCSVVVA